MKLLWLSFYVIWLIIGLIGIYYRWGKISISDAFFYSTGICLILFDSWKILTTKEKDT